MGNASADNSITIDYAAIGAAMQACCDAQYNTAQTIPDLEIQPVGYPMDCYDANGNLVVAAGTEITPGVTVPGGSYTPSQFGYYQTQLQYLAQTQASNQYNNQYQNWLNQWQEYQDQTTIPYMIQAIAAATQFALAMAVYLQCANLAKDAKQSVVAQIQAMEADVAKFRAAMCEHFDLLNAETANRITNFDEKGQWACDQRDDQLLAYEAYRDAQLSNDRVEGLHSKAYEMACRAEASSVSLEEFSQDMQACFELYKAAGLEDNVAEAIETMIAKLDECSTWLKDCADTLQTDYNTNYAGPAGNMSEVMMNEANVLVQGMSDIDTFTEGCRQTMKTLWETAYKGREEVHIPGLLQEAIDMTPNLTDVYEDLKSCKDDEHVPLWKRYIGEPDGQSGEWCLGRVVIDQACGFVNELKQVHDDLDDCSDERKATYDAAYKAKEEALAGEVLAQACALAPCLQVVHDWLCTHADEMQTHWDDFWKQKEEAYVCTVLDKGLARACELDEQLTQFCAEGDDFLEYWKDCYKELECQVNGKIIAAAERACEKNEETYGFICTQMEHLWDKFNDEWCPCDIDDLKRFCEFWEKLNPLDELCENHECQQDLATLLKDCYTDVVVPCEKRYIMEVCALEKYTPEYCEMETAALLNVRKQFDQQRERLIKGSSRWCGGATKQQLIELYTAQAAAEAAALAAANRFEKWWEVQECNRRHQYYLDVLERLGERWAATSLQAYQQDNILLDQILGRMHDRLLRGYEYARNFNDAGRSVLTAVGNAVSAGHQGMSIAQFWPSKYCELKAEYDRSSLQFMNHSADLMRIGQFYPAQAASDKIAAAQVAQGAVQLGQGTVNQGHAQLGMYHQQKVDAGRFAVEAINHGLQGIREGHFWADLIFREKQACFDMSQAAINDALQAYQIGQQHLVASLQAAEQQRALAATAAASGEAAAGRGLQMIATAADKVDSAQDAAAAALAQGNAFLRNGLNAAQLTAAAQESSSRVGAQGFQAWESLNGIGIRHTTMAQSHNQQSMAQLSQMLEMACQHLQFSYQTMADDHITGGLGAAQAAGAMMSGARDALNASGSDFIGGIAGLNQPPAFPNSPFGSAIASGVTVNSGFQGDFGSSYGGTSPFFTP